MSGHTTLEVGGPARYFAEPAGVEQLREALAWADAQGVRPHILGAGSNVVVADRGLDALVLRLGVAGIERDGERLAVGAGVNWDALVEWTVARDLAGLECLSGIPGAVGAAPMQNVGAYGQEVSETIESVQCVRLSDGARAEFDASECRFGYRDSVFKREAAGRYAVLEVRFRLRPGGAPKIAYPELARAAGPRPSLAQVRATVIALRRRKSMVIDPDDANRRSAGSFFVNPTLSHEAFTALEARAKRRAPADSMPRFETSDGRIKVPAAWLIERSGLEKGTKRGRVGLSTRHTLAIVNLGGATATELIAFAAEVRDRVREAFGVTLEPEPRFVGFTPEQLAPLLDDT